MDITWITDRVAVGGVIGTSENMATIRASGVSHIIDLQFDFDDTPLARSFGIEVCWVPLQDDFKPKPPEAFQRAVDFAMSALSRSGAKLFIHCLAGIHRGPMMTLAVLRAFGYDLPEAMKMIATKRYVVAFPDVYVSSVESYISGRQAKTRRFAS